MLMLSVTERLLLDCNCLIHVHLLSLWPWNSVVKVQHHHSEKYEYSHVYDLVSTIQNYTDHKEMPFSSFLHQNGHGIT
ncbi:hypothetical protein T06_11852 [Trichinella sp. T6]|nr:hypothetical protein T06_16375 [Trichinella sp. T6]KRX80632.1 hypothetical protein T06_11852 [Trichinella sp. T6]